MLTSRLRAFRLFLQHGQASPAPCKQSTQPECPQLRVVGSRMTSKHTQHVTASFSALVVLLLSSAISFFKAKVGT
jgi:hypothetical protein